MANKISSNKDIREQKTAAAIIKSIEKALESGKFNIKCIDWFSYNPDFHMEQHNKKVA